VTVLLARLGREADLASEGQVFTVTYVLQIRGLARFDLNVLIIQNSDFEVPHLLPKMLPTAITRQFCQQAESIIH